MMAYGVRLMTIIWELQQKTYANSIRITREEQDDFLHGSQARL